MSTHPGRNAREGTARIGVNSHAPQTYVAGALLATGFSLSEIYGDHVVLVRAAQSVKLYVGQKHAAGEAGGNVAPQTAPPVTSEDITDFVRLTPVYRHEVLTGYQAYPGARPSPFHHWGLKPGDVITAVDGVALVDPDQATAMFRMLASGAQLAATVKRGSAAVTVVLDGVAILAEQERAASVQVPPAANVMPPPAT